MHSKNIAQKPKKTRLKKGDVINAVTTTGESFSGTVKNISRHSSGAVFMEIEGGAK